MPQEPRTAAFSSMLRSSIDSSSSRAATRPRSVSGSPPTSPDACTSEASSSRNSGLPPLRSSSSSSHVGVDVAAEQRAHQLGGGLLVERVEAQQDRVLAPADRRAPPLQLGRARRGDEGERLAAELGDDAVEQVEHQRIGPVEVADGDDQRRLADEPLEEGQHRADHLAAGVGRVDGVEVGVGSPSSCRTPSVTRCTSGVSGPTPSADTTDRVAPLPHLVGQAPAGRCRRGCGSVRAIGPHTSDSP